jgi:hypothetical protein
MTVARLRHLAAVALATGLVAAALVSTPADGSSGRPHAWGHSKGQCRAVHATGIGTDDGAGTTTATIFRGRRAIGSTVGTFVAGTPTNGVVPFTGSIVFTDSHGTLVAPVVGTLDTTTGEFASSSDTVTGTGEYGAVTGRLTFRGVEDLAALTFAEVVHGKLCVPEHETH